MEVFDGMRDNANVVGRMSGDVGAFPECEVIHC